MAGITSRVARQIILMLGLSFPKIANDRFVCIVSCHDVAGAKTD